VNLLAILKLALWGGDQTATRPAVAQMTIISTEPVKRSSGSRSAPAQD